MVSDRMLGGGNRGVDDDLSGLNFPLLGKISVEKEYFLPAPERAFEVLLTYKIVIYRRRDSFLKIY